MDVEYVNRKGHRYYLHEGRTKTGKPKYYCSRKPAAAPLQSMPDGFEWRESPENATVSVRKRPSTRIAEFEREMLSDGIRKLAGLETFLTDVVKDSLVVYLPDRDPQQVDDLLTELAGVAPLGSGQFKEWVRGNVAYSAMMKFTLVDEDERSFAVDRWCFLGSIDRWFPLSGAAPLADQIREFVPHLGKESFFELM